MMATSSYLGFSRGAIGREMRRIVIGTVVVLLIVAGIGTALAVGNVYWDHTTGGWWVGPATVLVAVAAALTTWFVAAIVSLLVEIANSLRALVEREVA